MLAQMFSGKNYTVKKDNNFLICVSVENSSLKPDADNSYFIDRDSTYFRLVLNYLRDLKVKKKLSVSVNYNLVINFFFRSLLG